VSVLTLITLISIIHVEQLSEPAPCQWPWDQSVKMTAGLQTKNPSNKPSNTKKNLFTHVKER